MEPASFCPQLGGWIKDPHDPRDLKFSDLKTTLAAGPSRGVDMRNTFCPPLDNQLNAGSCVGNATAGALEIIERETGVPYVKLSRLFIYYNARAAQQATDKDVGCIIRDAIQTLSILGTCSEDTWPYDVAKVTFRPSWASYREGFAHRVTKYYRITSLDDELVGDIKFALEANMPVVFGMQVYQSFLDVGSDGRVPMPGGLLKGGHALCIVGYDDDKINLDGSKGAFIVRNSWGDQWGDNGYCYIPYAYYKTDEVGDFWVMTK